MMQNKMLQQENESLKLFNTEVEARNETLIYSYKIYEEKWNQIFHAF